MVTDRIYDDLGKSYHDHAVAALLALAKKLESPHCDKVFVAKDFTKRDVISEITRIVVDIEEVKNNSDNHRNIA